MEISLFGKLYTIPNSYSIMDELHLPLFIDDICWDEIILIEAIKKGHTSLCQRLKEVSHIYKYMFDVLKTARYNLCMACKEQYSESFMVSEEDYDWLRLQYLCNSLMWYNASFDIALQVISLYYGLSSKELKTESVDHILEECRWNVIENKKDNINSNIYKKLLNLKKKRININKWTIKFKHRGNLLKDDSEEEFFLNVTLKRKIGEIYKKDIIYDSSQTQHLIPINQTIDSIREYHKEIIEYLQEMSITLKFL